MDDDQRVSVAEMMMGELDFTRDGTCLLPLPMLLEHTVLGVPKLSVVIQSQNVEPLRSFTNARMCEQSSAL